MATLEDVQQAEAELRDLRTRRERAERAAEDMATLEAALIAAERDLDARTSPQLEAVRRSVQDLDDAIDDAFARIDDAVTMQGRLDAAGYTVRRACGPARAGALEGALADVAALRTELGRDL